MQNSRIAARRADNAEVRAEKARVRIREIHRVKSVENLHAKLNILPFGNRRAFDDAQIGAKEARTFKCIALERAELSGLRIGETSAKRRRVEIIKRIADSLRSELPAQIRDRTAIRK